MTDKGFHEWHIEIVSRKEGFFDKGNDYEMSILTGLLQQLELDGWIIHTVSPIGRDFMVAAYR
jgi:hypothetical protein